MTESQGVRIVHLVRPERRVAIDLESWGLLNRVVDAEDVLPTALISTTEDRKEGVMSFVEDRPPTFTGR